MMAIHTIAAGGGSILTFDGQRFRVGPESAGANPGPACYRRGGPLTVTDANVMLGKIQSGAFSSRIRTRGKPSTRRGDCSRPRLLRLLAKWKLRPAKINTGIGGRRIHPHRRRQWRTRSDSFPCSAATMSPATPLQCFGGAGGQHACLVADELGMMRVPIHPLAGVLSAYGMGLAEQRALVRERSVNAVLQEDVMPAIRTVLETLAAEARAELTSQPMRRGGDSRRTN